MPRGIGLITSLGAAALHDVATALRRRVPHIPVVLAPASVQGGNAPAELTRALQALLARSDDMDGAGTPLDVILLVRGGGSMEDLWAFNDEALAIALSESPIPVVSGVGHETDFTIADFVADVRAPTPTAAAELVATPTTTCLAAIDLMQERLSAAVQRQLDTQAQRLDRVATRAGRPSGVVVGHSLRLQQVAHQLQVAQQARLLEARRQHEALALKFSDRVHTLGRQAHARLDQAALRLRLLDPTLVLQRGYAWLADVQGATVTSVRQAGPGDVITATLADGTVDMAVRSVHEN